MKTVAIKKERLTKKQRLVRYCVGFTITFLALTFIKAISTMLTNPNGGAIDYSLLIWWDIIYMSATALWALGVFIIEFFKRD
jgi:hypothetical protein